MAGTRFIRVRIPELMPDMVTALPVKAGNRVILEAGTVLDDVIIHNLSEQPDIEELAIRSEFGEEIAFEEIRREMNVVRSIAVMKDVFGEEGQLTELTEETTKAIDSLADGVMNSLYSEDNILLKLEQLRSHDDFTYKHCLRVAVISAVTGKSLGLSDSVMKDLCRSALLHDIGMMKIEPSLIRKPGRLTDEEYAELKKHPQYGYFLLKRSGIYSQDVMNGVMMHQERMDGSGYPRGLSGNKISYFARIIMIADVYDALTSNRAYRSSFSAAESEEFIMGAAGTLFDYDIANAFLKVFLPYPVGTQVILSDGRRGSVIANSGNALRPVVAAGNQVIDLFNDYKNLTLSVIRTVHDETEGLGKSE